jgi:hypothetical protein
MRIQSWLVLAVVAGVALPVRAQGPPDPKPAIEAVKSVAFLEGRWSGEGWYQMGPGPKEEYTQAETIETKLDGAVLLIEGMGHSKGENARKVHHALAVISYDPVQKGLVFSSFLAGRPRLDVVPKVGANTFEWGFSPPNGGQIRYTIKVENGTWHELGEYSRDGQTWQPFMDMKLKRQS